MRECKIILRWTYRDFFNDLHDYQEDFNGMENFTNYLRWEPERAMAIGYTLADEWTMKKSRSTNVKLSLWYRDNGVEDEIPFESFGDFVHFIEQHPEVAKCVGYVRKK